MIRKMTYLVSLVLLLVQVNSASAFISWDDGGPDHLWSTAANWSPDTVPSHIDAASIDQPANTHCVIQAGITAACETLRVGNSGFTTNLDISGGSRPNASDFRELTSKPMSKMRRRGEVSRAVYVGSSRAERIS